MEILTAMWGFFFHISCILGIQFLISRKIEYIIKVKMPILKVGLAFNILSGLKAKMENMRKRNNLLIVLI
jgi:hypothetical protein